MIIDDMTKTIQKGPLTFEIEWHYDEDPLYDFIGKYEAKGPEEGYIDRQKGVLYGEAVEEPEEPYEEDFYKFVLGQPVDEKGMAAFDAALAKYEEAYDEWNDNYGLEILADELGSNHERNEYEFFVPYAGGEEPGSEHFVKYAIQDYDRITGLERGHWCFTGCVVTLSAFGVDLGRECLWGIESDCGDDYIAEAERESIASLIHDVPEYKDKLAGVLKALEEWEA